MNPDLWLPWAPLVAACLHIVEEFLFPGGFPAWYRRWRGADSTSVTPRFLVIINGLMLFGAVEVALVARSGQDLWWWFGLAGVLAGNGLWHGYASMRSRSYSPGTVTGLLLYVPATVYGLVHYLGTGRVSAPAALVAIAVGGTYQFWSKTYHQLRSRGASQLARP